MTEVDDRGCLGHFKVAFRVWWEILASRFSNPARYNIHLDTPWGNSLTFRWSSYNNTVGRKIEVAQLKSVRLEAQGYSQLLHYYSPRQGEVLNSKYGWCVISPQLNLNTMVLHLYIYRLTIKLEQFYLMTLPFAPVHSVIFMLVTGTSLEHQLSIFISQPTALGARTETIQVRQALEIKCERSNLNEGDFTFAHPGGGSGNKEKRERNIQKGIKPDLFL